MEERETGLIAGCSTTDEDCGSWEGKTKVTTFQKGYSAFPGRGGEGTVLNP